MEIQVLKNSNKINYKIIVNSEDIQIPFRSNQTDRQIASLTVQCRQVYCLVEMAPSAPSWRPPHHGVSSTASNA